MYHETGHDPDTNNAKENRRIKSRIPWLFSAILLLAFSVGGTLAWLAAKDAPIANTFVPANVSCRVTEIFDGETKSCVNVQNTGNASAYIRVKLVTYRVNEAGQHIGGTATIPAFTPGNGWIEYDGCYYYTQPVAAGASPAADLIDHIALTGTYSDADGGRQVIEVMAEAIQADADQSITEKVVGESWGVTIADGSVKAYTGGGTQ